MPRPEEPHYSFTIPSIHDDITLDCRIYHPTFLADEQAELPVLEGTWRKRGIVMAHPYAPMGGSHDDRVVGIVVDEFLQAGWIVGTFNFRGAHGSKGHTSWSGKPELDDYISFAALFIHYMSHIQHYSATEKIPTPKASPESSQSCSSPAYFPPSAEPPIVALGGYSYGSLILKHLPPIPTIVQPFSTPISGSAAHEIMIRSHKLAEQSNQEWLHRAQSQERARRSRITRHRPKASVTMGGEELSPEKRRSSRDIRRSLDGHRSIDLGNKFRSFSHRKPKQDVPATPPENQDPVPVTLPEVRYLLISPLTGPLSILAAPALGIKFWHKTPDADDEVIGKFSTLAVYGDQDIFASAKKNRDWSEHLKTRSTSHFSGVEVAGAGHFWVEPGVEDELRKALKEWANSA